VSDAASLHSRAVTDQQLAHAMDGEPDAVSGGSGAVTVTVTEALEVDEELVSAFARVIPQLSSSSPPPTAEQLGEIVASPATVLFIARTGGGTVVGSLTLAIFRVPTGVLSWIEDVVVDEAARGAGVGEQLVAAAIHRAEDAGAKSVDLTSRPSREAANRLYQRAGFQTRETNVYRRKFSHNS
jgi:ribosomal protein S18 acetylase RimI-like enzyme